MSFLGQNEQIQEFQLRFKYLYIALAISMLLLVSRLWWLQIFQGDTFRRYSEENRLKRVKIKAPRGMMFDRNKRLIIDNRPAFDLEITPEELYASKDWKHTVEKISGILGLKKNLIPDLLEQTKSQPKFLPIKIKQDLTVNEVAIIESRKLDLPGISIQMEIKRTNIYRDLASHQMGYIGEVTSTELPRLNKAIGPGGIPYRMNDSTGKSGLESKWEGVLRGVDGEEYLEVDAFGHRRKTSGSGITKSLAAKPVIPGKNIILTIDQDLQNIALETFEKVLGKKMIGAVIAISPKTGEVLVSVSQPSFDPTEFSRGISALRWNELLNNEYRPLRDKTIQDHYSPASTFKAITAIAGLEEGEIDEKSTVNCTGNFVYGNRPFHCWKKHGHGTVDIHKALAASCDVFFYKLAVKLGIDRIAKYARMLGLGHRTGINLSNEESGLIPTEGWKKQRFGTEWNPGESLMCGIGQSYVLTTPIQLANAYAAIGTGGQIWTPFLVKYIESPNGRILKEFQPQLMNKVTISKKNLEIIHKGLLQVVNAPFGTAYGQNATGYDIAGKTGTSQVIGLTAEKLKSTKCENMPFNVRDHGLFVAFAPVDDPIISVAVVTEHSCHGAGRAAPIALEVIKQYLKKMIPEKYNDEAVKKRQRALVKTYSGQAARKEEHGD